MYCTARLLHLIRRSVFAFVLVNTFVVYAFIIYVTMYFKLNKWLSLEKKTYVILSTHWFNRNEKRICLTQSSYGTKLIHDFYFRAREDEMDEDEKAKPNPIDQVLNLFLFVWFICGKFF